MKIEGLQNDPTGTENVERDTNSGVERNGYFQSVLIR